MRRKLSEESIRKISKSGASYAVTLPISIMRKLKWKEKQKVVVKRRGNAVVIMDWEK